MAISDPMTRNSERSMRSNPPFPVRRYHGLDGPRPCCPQSRRAASAGGRCHCPCTAQDRTGAVRHWTATIPAHLEARGVDVRVGDELAGGGRRSCLSRIRQETCRSAWPNSGCGTDRLHPASLGLGVRPIGKPDGIPHPLCRSWINRRAFVHSPRAFPI